MSVLDRLSNHELALAYIVVGGMTSWLGTVVVNQYKEAQAASRLEVQREAALVQSTAQGIGDLVSRRVIFGGAQFSITENGEEGVFSLSIRQGNKLRQAIVKMDRHDGIVRPEGTNAISLREYSCNETSCDDLQSSILMQRDDKGDWTVKDSGRTLDARFGTDVAKLEVDKILDSANPAT